LIFVNAIVLETLKLSLMMVMGEAEGSALKHSERSSRTRCHWTQDRLDFPSVTVPRQLLSYGAAVGLRYSTGEYSLQ